MRIKAYAKVNLALDVTGKRDDGYHELDMVMASLDLADELDITPSQDGQDHITCAQMSLPPVNTLSQTLDLLRSRGLIHKHYNVALIKNIPDQAGLGGGSADAAALIKALSIVENVPLSTSEMMELGANVGADVPYCLLGGYARVQGIGEKARPLYIDWKIPVLLVKPEAGLSTPESFARYDAQENRAYDIDIVEDALLKQDISLLYQTMANALEPQAMEELPVLAQIKKDLNDLGIVRVMMTGSGSTMMGFCVDEDLIDQAAEALREKYPFVKKARIG